MDPEYARAHLGQAEALILAAVHLLLPPEEALSRAQAAAERALQLDPELAEAYAAYRDFAESYEQIGHFLEEIYTKKRIHSALGYLTPEEFEAAWKANAQPERTEEVSLLTRESKCVQL